MGDEASYPSGYSPSFYQQIPTTIYGKYVEAWNYFHGNQHAKKVVQDLANKAWKVASDKEKVDLVKKHIADVSKRKFLKQPSLQSFLKPVNKPSADKVSTSQCDVAADVIFAKHTSSVNPLNAADAYLSREEYISSHEKVLINSFLKSFGSRHVDIFDETGEKSLLLSKSLLDAAKSYNKISDDLTTYRALQQRTKKTEFSSKMEEFEKMREETGKKILEAINIKIEPALGLAVLKKNAEIKENLFKEVSLNCQQMVSFVNSASFSINLRRRVTQMNERDSRKLHRSNFECATITCFNNGSLTWESAFRKLCGDFQSFDRHVMNVGLLMEESSIVDVKEILKYISQTSERKFINELLIAFPLLYTKTVGGAEFIVNLHQTSSGCKDIDDLLKSEDESNSHSKRKENKSVSQKKSITPQGKSGPVSVEIKFPDIAKVATEFIQQNGYKAQEKRRDNNFVSCGVSVENVRQHLLENVPGLKDYGLSYSTLRYLFQPVNKSRSSSKLYKSLIKCRVPKKDNRENNEDAHFLHCRVNLRLEQAFFFEEEHIAFSADAMNKINVGTLCVSRYHQIRRIYSEEDQPKYKDHDFPLGYKIIPCGKMPLLKKGIHLHDIFCDVDFQTLNDPVDIYSEEMEEEDYEFDVDGCVKVVNRPEPVSIEDHDNIDVDFEISDMILNENEVIIENQLTEDLASVEDQDDAVNADIRISDEDRYEIQPTTGTVTTATSAEDVTDTDVHEDTDNDVAEDISDIESIPSIDSSPADAAVSMSLNEYDIKVDKVGRSHVDHPRTGPVLVFDRNGVFHQQTMEGHANDFLPLFKASVQSDKTCIVCIVDNGPDMDPTNYLNEIYWGKLWKDSGADMIQCISYAAGQSAYNPIEHAWSPLSNCLTGVVLPAILPDDELPPSKQDLSEVERAEKEAEMLDLAAERLSSYWKNITYDGHAVVPINIPSREMNKTYDDHEKVHTFIEAPMRDFKTVDYLKNLRKEFKFFTKHAIRRESEFVILKCQFFRLPEEVCKYCRNHPPTATKTLDFMKKNNGKLFEPMKSSTHDSHYHTFLEMCKMMPITSDEAGTSELGSCEICPSWKFTSNSEVDRHKRLLHPDENMSNICSKRKFKCNHKVDGSDVCGEVFSTQYRLNQHKDTKGHKRTRQEKAKQDEETLKKKKNRVAQEFFVAKSLTKK